MKTQQIQRRQVLVNNLFNKFMEANHARLS